jgi:hypothetical protein
VNGTLSITRESGGWRDRFRSYDVLVDGEKAATVGRGQTVVVPVKPGAHSVQLAIDWGRSAAVEVAVEEGVTVELRCAPNTSQSSRKSITSGAAEYAHLWLA